MRMYRDENRLKFSKITFYHGLLREIKNHQ